MADESRSDIRARAEELIQKGRLDLEQFVPEDLAALVLELQVHHLELEMQNEELRRAQQELERSRDRYVELYDLAPVGYVTLDDGGRIVEANLTTTTILGHSRRRLRGTPLRDFVLREFQDAYFRHRRQVRQERVRSSCEMQMRRADGSAVWVRVVSQLAGDAPSDGEEMRVTLSDITPLKKAEEELRILNETLEQRVEQRTAEAAMKSEQLRALAHELGRTELRERRQLAELIHDSLKQEVAGARMLLGAVTPHVQGDDARATLEQVDQVLRHAIQTCRTLNDELCPPVLRGAGLVPALRWLANRFREQHGLQVEVRATTDLEPARDEVSASLFRSVRELLYNVVKYAEVDAALVEVSSPKDGLLELAVDDRGRGFDPAVLDEPTVGGFGLFAVRERIEMMGGSIRVRSVPGDGTRVSLRCPVGQADARPADPTRAWTPPRAAPAPDSARPATRGVRRVIVVDDHVVMREGLASLLDDLDDLEVVGFARNGEEAVRIALELAPDVVVMDVTMPGMDGVEATVEITQALPGTRVLGLSMHGDPETERRMRRAGAAGYLVKDTPAAELIEAIRRV